MTANTDNRLSLRGEAVRFAVIGAGITLLGIALMALFYNLFQLGYWWSSAIAYLLCSILSLVLNHRFIFRNNEPLDQTAPTFFVNIGACYIVAYLVAKPLMAHLLGDLFLGNAEFIDQAAMLVGVGLFTGLNFLGQKFIVFDGVDPAVDLTTEGHLDRCCGIISGRKELFLTVAMALVLLAIKLRARAPVLTGDEPRYLHMAYSFYRTFGFRLPYADWVTFSTAHGIRLLEPQHLVSQHAPFGSILLSPFVGLFGLIGGRAAIYTVSLGAFVLVTRILRSIVGRVAAVLIACFIFSTLPGFAYSSLLYTEMWLATDVALALLLVIRGRISWALVIGGGIAILVLPILHIRMSLVAAVFVAALAYRIWRHRELDLHHRRNLLIGLGLLCLLMLGIFVGFQLAWTGSLRGSASAPYRPGLLSFLERTAVQVFTVRHGLVIYNPLFLLAGVGLIIGVIDRNRPAMLAAAITAVYLVTFVWGAASESFPARFWVAILPALAIGIAVWLKRARHPVLRVITVIAVILAFANAALYAFHPDLFLTNRQICHTYDALHRIIPLFHLSPYIPWDSFFDLERQCTPHIHESQLLLLWWSVISTGMVGLIVTLVYARRFCLRTILATVIGLLVIGGALLTLATPLSTDHYVVTASIEENGYALTITFDRPTRASAITFAQEPLIWPTPGHPETVVIGTSTDGTFFSPVGRRRATGIVGIPGYRSLKAIRLTAEGPHRPNWIDVHQIAVLVNTLGWRPGERPSPATIPLVHITDRAAPRFACPLGVRHPTTLGGSGEPFLVWGWHPTEAGGCWSAGAIATLGFSLADPPARDLTLRLDGFAFLTPRYPTQIMVVRSGDRVLGTISYALGDPDTRRLVTVPADLVDGMPTILLIDLVVDAPHSPLAIGHSADPRTLGLHLQAVTIDEEEPR